jgi:hypothetical protein
MCFFRQELFSNDDGEDPFKDFGGSDEDDDWDILDD